MSAQEQQIQFLLQRIEALQNENERLNNDIKKVKEVAFKISLTDPNFDKPINEINVKL